MQTNDIALQFSTYAQEEYTKEGHVAQTPTH